MTVTVKDIFFKCVSLGWAASGYALGPGRGSGGNVSHPISGQCLDGPAGYLCSRVGNVTRVMAN